MGNSYIIDVHSSSDVQVFKYIQPAADKIPSRFREPSTQKNANPLKSEHLGRANQADISLPDIVSIPVISTAGSSSSDDDGMNSRLDDEAIDADGKYMHHKASVTTYRFIAVRGCLI